MKAFVVSRVLALFCPVESNCQLTNLPFASPQRFPYNTLYVSLKIGRSHPVMAPAETNPSPFGVLNLKAAVEASFILQESDKIHHQHLYRWLAGNYLSDSLRTALANVEEPLGRRIRSSEDLSALVVAYSNARALKQKNMKRKMDHELYFYGQLPDRDGAVEAGSAVRTQFDPSVIVASSRAVHGNPTQ